MKPKLDESESDQMVLEKVTLAYFNVYLSQTMWNHTKNSMKTLKRPTSVFLQGDLLTLRDADRHASSNLPFRRLNLAFEANFCTCGYSNL